MASWVWRGDENRRYDVYDTSFTLYGIQKSEVPSETGTVFQGEPGTWTPNSFKCPRNAVTRPLA